MVVVVVGEEGAAAAMIITGIHSHSLSPGQEQAWQEEYTSLMIVFLFGTPPHCACAHTSAAKHSRRKLCRKNGEEELIFPAPHSGEGPAASRPGSVTGTHSDGGGGGAIYWHPALPWLIYL